MDLLRSVGAGISRRLRSKPPAEGAAELVEPELKSTVEQRMIEHWRSCGISDETCRIWLSDAFDLYQYRDTVSRCKRIWGQLADKSVLDLGCGWGSLSVLLAREGANVTFVDRVDAHVEVARMRIPRGRGLVADAREIGERHELSESSFDYVLLNSLIEHVGPPPEHRGDAESSLADKRRVLVNAARKVGLGGGVYVATGNFAFPLDGEIKTWFFHWLPPEEQKLILSGRGLNADLYGLLRWQQLVDLCGEAGLRLEHVESVELPGLQFLLKCLSFASKVPGYRLPRAEVECLRKLVVAEPEFMPTWFAFFRRAA